jgi:glucosamine--fructose-6-phosphate aminotransferase (isomerizing)
LKHGPLALIDQNMTVLVLMTRDALYSKNQNTLEQVVARLGRPIALCGPNDEFVKSKVQSKAFWAQGVPRPRLTIFLQVALQDILEIPEIGVDCLQPVLNVIPLQLLSYHIAVLKGVNVDRPRNLAKSVTVTE